MKLVIGFALGVWAMTLLDWLDPSTPAPSAYSVRLADSPGSCGR
jgi:hypothetical protein